MPEEDNKLPERHQKSKLFHEFTLPSSVSFFSAENKRYKISAKYFSLPLRIHTNSMCWDRWYRKKNIRLLYTKTMKKVDGSLPIGFVNEDFWKKKNDNTFPFICLRRKWIIYPHCMKNSKNEKILAVREML